MTGAIDRFASLDGGTLPAALQWVKDAPLFIDDANLDRFYDAVVRPVFVEKGPRTLRISESEKRELQAKLAGSGKVGLPAWLTAIFSADVQVSAEGQVASGRTDAREHTILLEAISTPQRQLEQLTAYYLLRQPDRLFSGGMDGPVRWQASGASRAVPRALAFIDLAPGAMMIPMAAEFDSGKLVTLFERLTAKSGERPPEFAPGTQDEYWGWFAKNFDPGQATRAIEDAAVVDGRIACIDFRVPLNDRHETMHLHLETRGRYMTNILAYRLVRRGTSNGLRIVATMMDGPDFNVLAIYEK